MKKEIKFEVRNNYGVKRIHPACHISSAMIKLKAGKTFHKDDLDVFKSLGYEIKWKAGQI